MGPTGKHPSTVYERKQRTMKRVLGLILSAIFVFQLGAPVYAAETIQENETPSEMGETANIDGTNYTFGYDYSPDSRVLPLRMRRPAMSMWWSMIWRILSSI